MFGRFTTRARLPKFFLKSFKTQLGQLSEREVKQAAREWLRAVIKEIPTFTGTARGTFKPLGQFLRVAIPQHTPKSDRKSKRINGRVYQLGFAAGAQYGEDFEFKQDGLRYEFNYTVELPYIWWNSFGPGPANLTKPTPWFAIQKGTTAFGNHIREEIPGKISAIMRKSLRGKVIK